MLLFFLGHFPPVPKHCIYYHGSCSPSFFFTLFFPGFFSFSPVHSPFSLDLPLCAQRTLGLFNPLLLACPFFSFILLGGPFSEPPLKVSKTLTSFSQFTRPLCGTRPVPINPGKSNTFFPVQPVFSTLWRPCRRLLLTFSTPGLLVFFPLFGSFPGFLFFPTALGVPLTSVLLYVSCLWRTRLAFRLRLF